MQNTPSSMFDRVWNTLLILSNALKNNIKVLKRHLLYFLKSTAELQYVKKKKEDFH